MSNFKFSNPTIALLILVTSLIIHYVISAYDLNEEESERPVNSLVLCLYFVFTVSALYLLKRVYHFLFSPLEYTKEAGSVQFGEVKKFLGSSGASLQLSRTVGDFPPPYPNGWYVLTRSLDLKKGDVRPMNVLGGQYALWRDMSGKAHMFGAYCPHLGANLAFGGIVQDNCLRCPFHGWEYDGDGNNCRIPYASDTNKFAKAKTYLIMEQDQIIYFWFDA